MRSGPWILLTILCLAPAVGVTSALADSRVIFPHIVDSLEVELDSIPPSRPVCRVKEIRRGVAREGGTNIDQYGFITLAVESDDDRSRSFEIGYRLSLVAGTPPLGLTFHREDIRVFGCDSIGNAECELVLDWFDGRSNEQEPLDFSFVAVAIDRGGNRSEVSDTIRVRDPGSTTTSGSASALDRALWKWILAGLLVVTGFVGVVTPVLPGAPLVLAGLIVAAWAEDFRYVGWSAITILAILTALTYFVDAVAAALGVKKAGASKYAVWGAVIGTTVGVFFGIPGILLGPFLGAVAGELFVSRDVKHVGRAGVAAWIGFIIGTLGKLALMFTMVGVFIVARLV